MKVAMKVCERLTWKASALALALALGCAACGGGSSGGSSGSGTSATFKKGACPADQADALAALNATCGTLTAPQNRSKPSEGKVQLPVAIIPSKTQPASPDPVVYMAGGPGANAIGQAAILDKVGLDQNRDLIIMNQRGVLYTEPLLTCPEIDQFNAEAVGLPNDSPATGTMHVAATKACHDRLVGEGIDLSNFNTTENAADFADLRKALHIKEWNVYGLSYGTYLALVLMREHPEGIRSVMIDAVLPPSAAGLGWTWTNANEAVNNIFRACANQIDCANTFGDLSAIVQTQVNKLEDNPLSMTISEDFGDVKVVIDGGALINWLASVPPDPVSKIADIPLAIQELVDGTPTQIAKSRAGAADPAGFGAVGYGLQYGVTCSEWVPFEPASQILVQGRLAFPNYPDSVLSLAPGLPFMTEDCQVWDVPKADASIRQVTVSSIPTLVLNGAFDGKTSPQWGVYVAGTLENSTTVTVPSAGHGSLFLIGLPEDVPARKCVEGVVASFLSNPMAPDTSCVAGLTDVPFTVPAPGDSSSAQPAPELSPLFMFQGPY